MNSALLNNFPNLCRGCLKHLPSDQLVSLDCVPIGCNGYSVAECYAEFAPEVVQDDSNMFPSEVCYNCLNELIAFLSFRKRHTFLSKFIAAMAQLRQGKQTLMVDLFFADKDYMQQVLQELELCEGKFLLTDLVDSVEEISKEDVKSDLSIEELYLDDFTEDDDKFVEVEIKSEEEIDDYSDTEQPIEFVEIAHNVVQDTPKKLVNVSKCLVNDSQKQKTSMRPRGRPKGQKAKITEEKQTKEKELVSFDKMFPEVIIPLTDIMDELKNRKDSVLLFDKDCHKSFDNHQNKFRQKKTNYVCPERMCKKKAFGTRAELVQHRKKFHRKNVCEICGETFVSLSGLVNHIQRHVRPTLQCSYCDLTLYTKTELQQHMQRRHIKNKETACSICGLYFADNRILKTHMETHSAERKFSCEFCESTFKTKIHKGRHIDEVHMNKRYTCPHCQNSYGRKDKLRMHLEAKHNIQSYFVCDICLATFNTQDKLDDHKTRHENPKTLECAICLLAFENRKNFKTHSCISYRDDYVCCGRDWKHHHYYNKHQLLVHGVKTNVRVKPDPNNLIGAIRAKRKQQIRCTKCEKPFPSRIKKKLHEQTCSDSSPYSLKSVLIDQ
ncbi:PR domain zinc finger protein 5-like [Wyeomyia smithii]|uniref:PR domain zinc finger protein 5-like n=1 Tax=Wyeomyia smithii TaxID=174621 RepID=UPI002467CC2B|nr:PR domain zinc finger protein 5-like [Wyeomyia smithii]